MDDDTAGRIAQRTTETHWTEAGDLDDEDDTMTKAYKSMTRLAMRMDKAAEQYALMSESTAEQYALLAESSHLAAVHLRGAAKALKDTASPEEE